MRAARDRAPSTALSAMMALSLAGSASALAGHPAAAAQTPAGLANPASENCEGKGGRLFIEQRGDGGEYGVCIFEDNRQCEEWALLRGQCPVGGLKVTGYVTPAARYCAITGGQYKVTGDRSAEQEQGTCTLPSGRVCDVWAYYSGQCG